MTLAETSKLMALIAEEHSSFLNTPNPKTRLNLWFETFESLPYELVEHAVKQTLKHKDDGYAPKLSDIVNCVKETIRRDDDNVEAAWKKLAKAAARATRVTQEEFDALPYEVKGFCGNLAGLKSLGNNEEYIFNSVTRGQFMKAYDNLRNRKEARESMSPEILAIARRLIPELPSATAPKKRAIPAPIPPASPPPPELERILSKPLPTKPEPGGYKPPSDEEFDALRNEQMAKLEKMAAQP